VNKTDGGSGLIYVSCNGSNGGGTENGSSRTAIVRPIYEATSSHPIHSEDDNCNVHQTIRRDSTYIVGESIKLKLYILGCWLSNQVESHLTHQDSAKTDAWLHSSQLHSCSVTEVYMNSV
jgi:hypothetical protein